MPGLLNQLKLLPQQQGQTCVQTGREAWRGRDTGGTVTGLTCTGLSRVCG